MIGLNKNNLHYEQLFDTHVLHSFKTIVRQTIFYTTKSQEIADENFNN